MRDESRKVERFNTWQAFLLKTDESTMVLINALEEAAE